MSMFKMIAAVAVLTTAATGAAHAMMEQPTEIVLGKNGCGQSPDNSNYVFEGDLPAGRFAWVKLDTDAGRLNYAPTITAVTRDQRPTGGVIEYRGMNPKGYAVYWIPKKVHYMLLYFTPDERQDAVYGKVEVCVRKSAR